jgi:predicted PhzF superfamily epimerase YddE/YHI9
MGVPLAVVDAFASRAFTGNPAAVCLLDEPAAEPWMQAIAAEMNLSETAFVRSLGDDHFELRWFTPTVEAELCGHATLATAHVLWEARRLSPEARARFRTRSGILTAARTPEGIELDFPADPVERADPDPEVMAALGADAVGAATGKIGWLVELADEGAVRRLRPDFRALARFGGAVVTAASDSADYDFVSRYFAPGFGIDEDPVTGAAHCALGPYWAARLGRAEVVGYQASTRGGHVTARVASERVILRGRAVTVLRGELTARAYPGGIPHRGRRRS